MRNLKIAAALLILLPMRAVAVAPAETEFADDVIRLPGIESVADVRSIVPDLATVEVLDESPDGRMIDIVLAMDDDVVEGTIDRQNATLSLYMGPGTEGCYAYYTGASQCIFHVLYMYYCWAGSWYCYFYQPSCFWKQIPASCE